MRLDGGVVAQALRAIASDNIFELFSVEARENGPS